MKKVATILSLISGTVIALVGLVFSVLEIRLLVSGDFLVYSYPLGGFFTILIRLLTSLFAVFIGIFPYFHLGRKENRQRIIANGILTLSMLVMAIVLEFVFASFGYEFYIYAVCLAFALIYIISQFIIFLKTIVLKEPIDKKVSNS